MTGTLLLPSELVALVWPDAKQHPLQITMVDDLLPLRDAMRAAVPKDGIDVVKWMTVLLGPGSEQGSALPEHQHPEWTVLWYPRA